MANQNDSLKKCIEHGHEFSSDDDSISRCIRCNEHPLETLRKYEVVMTWDNEHIEGLKKRRVEMDKLTASEALYGFAGWITTRKESLTAGGNNECGIWAKKVSEFCKANNLEKPREGWSDNLIHPEESGEIIDGKA